MTKQVEVTKQNGFSVMAGVDKGKVEELGRLLDEIGDDIDENPHLRFSDLANLHYASFVIVDAGESPYLLFEGNIDGSIKGFFEDLVRTAPKAVDSIYSHCVGYPSAGASDSAATVRYLLSRDIGISAFYVAWPQQSLDEIAKEQLLRDRLEDFLDRDLAVGNLEGLSAYEIRGRLQAFVRNDALLSWAATRRQRPFLVRRGDRVVQLIIAALVAGVGATAWTAIRSSSRKRRTHSRIALLTFTAGAAAAGVLLDRAEKSDDKLEAERTVDWETTYAQWSENLGGIVQRENVQGQNHMVSVTKIKQGWFRLAALRVVLFAVNAAARLTANKGTLAGISSIHFARWVITPDRKTLIFLSNFDGSWERYLNDFIDLASKGLTAVWCNTTSDVCFPKTRRLIFEGARDEQRFKAYSRHSQVRTRAWYSAYPRLSNENIANNAAIRDGLFTDIDETEAQAWLQRL